MDLIDGRLKDNSAASRIYDPPFKAFNPDASVRIYFTNMPHWRQDGCTYFVTYRLANSIPRQILDRWNQEKAKWIAARGVKIADPRQWKDGFLQLKEGDRSTFLKLFNRQLNSFLDEGRGRCVLRAPRCAKAVLAGWEYFNGIRYRLGDVIVMPNHVHLLVTPHPSWSLEDVLRSRKRQSAREINAITGHSGSLWQKHSFDHIVRTANSLLWFQQYIADNPQKAKIQKGGCLHRRHDWTNALNLPQ